MYNKVLLLVGLLIGAALFTGCDSDGGEPKEFTIQNSDALNQSVFADETQGASLNFATIAEWTSEIKPADATQWLSIAPQNGNEAGDYTVSISLATNTTGEDRTATITIACEGKEIVINITQKATTEDGELYNPDPEFIEMVYVTSGTFMMGSPIGVGYDNESPQHQVTLDSYSIGKYEVTQGLWWAVMGSWSWTAPSSDFGVGDNYPMYFVSWEDIVGTASSDVGYTVNGITYYQNGFCYKLSQTVGGGKQYRLPTEAEWEYAARGGSATKNCTGGCDYSGSNTVDDVAWYSGNNSPNGTKPVGGKLPNELDIYDMSGNVLEWCGDWSGSYSSTAQTNPTGPISGSSRVLHGGCWGSDATGARVAARGNGTPGVRVYYVGFRLACSSN